MLAAASLTVKHTWSYVYLPNIYEHNFTSWTTAPKTAQNMCETRTTHDFSWLKKLRKISDLCGNHFSFLCICVHA